MQMFSPQDNREDYEKILEKYEEPKENHKDRSLIPDSARLLDFNSLSKDYDGVRLTQKGIQENKESFEFWDVESTLWFNLDNFNSIDYKKGSYKE